MISFNQFSFIASFTLCFLRNLRVYTHFTELFEEARHNSILYIYEYGVLCYILYIYYIIHACIIGTVGIS